jgi:hypothetical protein
LQFSARRSRWQTLQREITRQVLDLERIHFILAMNVDGLDFDWTPTGSEGEDEPKGDPHSSSSSSDECMALDGSDDELVFGERTLFLGVPLLQAHQIVLA